MGWQIKFDLFITPNTSIAIVVLHEARMLWKCYVAYETFLYSKKVSHYQMIKKSY